MWILNNFCYFIPCQFFYLLTIPEKGWTLVFNIWDSKFVSFKLLLVKHESWSNTSLRPKIDNIKRQVAFLQMSIFDSAFELIKIAYTFSLRLSAPSDNLIKQYLANLFIWHRYAIIIKYLISSCTFSDIIFAR